VSGIEKLGAPHNLGTYPSAYAERLISFDGQHIGEQLGPMNDTNCGIEAVFQALELPGGPKVRLAELGNTDGDRVAGAPDSPELHEFLDAWGNPFAYFSASEYEDPIGATRYVLRDGRVVSVLPRRDRSTGRFFNEHHYQLISAGPDERFGSQDDIKNW
jgi:hypothetical protein